MSRRTTMDFGRTDAITEGFLTENGQSEHPNRDDRWEEAISSGGDRPRSGPHLAKEEETLAPELRRG